MGEGGGEDWIDVDKVGGVGSKQSAIWYLKDMILSWCTQLIIPYDILQGVPFYWYPHKFFKLKILLYPLALKAISEQLT